MEKAQAAVDAAKDAAMAAEPGVPQDEEALERAKESAQEAISKAEQINQQEQADASTPQETSQTDANQEQLDGMREDVNNLDASMTPLDKQRQEVRDAADKAENAAESIPNTTTQEEVTELRKEAVDAAIDAYEKADMTDPPQARDVERAKEAAEQALAMDPNMTDEEREEAEELLEAIPTEEDAIREAFEESGLPEELFEEFKEGWDEYMESLMDGETSPSSRIKPPRPENPQTDVKQWLMRPVGELAYYVDVTIEGVAEWWYQSGNRREDLIYEDSTELRIVNGANWAKNPAAMRFFTVDTDGEDLIVRY